MIEILTETYFYGLRDMWTNNFEHKKRKQN